MGRVRDRAGAVIVGGGAVGLGIAYRLVEMGMKGVVVIEKGYLGSGATGRCAGGIRQQWGAEENIVLARESVRLWERLSEELGFNVWFRQGGYLLLAFTEEELASFERNVKLQNSLGVPSRVVGPEEVRRIAPAVEAEVLGGAYCPTDGIAHHDPVVWGYARAARRLGVEVEPFTEVRAIEVAGGRVKGVKTTRGEIESPVVVNAAGAEARDVARMAGVELPNTPYRREILVTEPLKPFLDPLVISFHHNTYFAQTMRGEVVAGTGDAEPPAYRMDSSLEFLERTAKALVTLAPRLSGVKVLRQWAGLYDVTPDGKPILGVTDGLEGFIQANGFCGHGFMLSPIVAKLVAELVVDGRTSIPIDSLNLRRFKGEVKGEGMAVG